MCSARGAPTVRAMDDAGRMDEEALAALDLPPLEGPALITGASGFIGSRLRDALLAAGADVVSLRRPGAPPAKRGRSVEASYGDVTSLERAVTEARPAYVFHVAGVTKGVRYEDFRRGNVMPTENLLLAVRKQAPDVRRCVHVSSGAAYGPTVAERPLTEDDPRRPLEYYGQSKLEAERAVEAWDTLPWTLALPVAVYGPGDVDVFELFRLGRLGLKLFYGNRNQVMSTIYVDDLIRGLVLAATKEAAIGRSYFLAEESTTTWGAFQDAIARLRRLPSLTLDLGAGAADLAGALGELATKLDGKPRVLNRQKAQLNRAEAWLFDAARARAELGFQTRVSRAEGIPRTDAWYRAAGWY